MNREQKRMMQRQGANPDGTGHARRAQAAQAQRRAPKKRAGHPAVLPRGARRDAPGRLAHSPGDHQLHEHHPLRAARDDRPDLRAELRSSASSSCSCSRSRPTDDGTDMTHTSNETTDEPPTRSTRPSRPTPSRPRSSTSRPSSTERRARSSRTPRTTARRRGRRATTRTRPDRREPLRPTRAAGTWSTPTRATRTR